MCSVERRDGPDARDDDAAPVARRDAAEALREHRRQLLDQQHRLGHLLELGMPNGWVPAGLPPDESDEPDPCEPHPDQDLRAVAREMLGDLRPVRSAWIASKNHPDEKEDHECNSAPVR